MYGASTTGSHIKIFPTDLSLTDNVNNIGREKTRVRAIDFQYKLIVCHVS